MYMLALMLRNVRLRVGIQREADRLSPSAEAWNRLLMLVARLWGARIVYGNGPAHARFAGRSLADADSASSDRRSQDGARRHGPASSPVPGSPIHITGQRTARRRPGVGARLPDIGHMPVTPPRSGVRPGTVYIAVADATRLSPQLNPVLQGPPIKCRMPNA